MILHVLVNIKCVELLAVKACEEHAHHEKQVQRFHCWVFLLHSAVNVIIVGTEILGGVLCTVTLVVVVHDGLQLIALCIVISKTSIHASVIILLVGVLLIGEHGTNGDFRIERFENLVIFDKL